MVKVIGVVQNVVITMGVLGNMKAPSDVKLVNGGLEVVDLLGHQAGLVLREEIGEELRSSQVEVRVEEHVELGVAGVGITGTKHVAAEVLMSAHVALKNIWTL